MSRARAAELNRSLVLTYDIRKSVEASSKTEDSYYQWKMLWLKLLQHWAIPS